MKKFNGKSKAELEARAKELNANSESWETGELGESEEHARVMRKTSIRMPDDMIASLKSMAGDKSMGYQTYIRMVLAEHIQDKLKAS